VAEDVFSEIAKSVPELDKRIKEAEDYISALEEAGEDTTALRSTLRENKARLNRWKSMLKSRGKLK